MLRRRVLLIDAKERGILSQILPGTDPSLNAGPALPRTRHTCRHNESHARQIIGIDFTPWWCLTGDSGSDRISACARSGPGRGPIRPLLLLLGYY